MSLVTYYRKKEWHGFWFSKLGHLKKIIKIRDGTPLEAEGIMTYRKSWMSLVTYYRKKEWHGFWFSKLGHLKKIIKIRDGTPLEAEGIMTYRKRNSKNSRWYPFGGGRNFDIQKNDLETARFGHLKKILKIRDGTPLEAEGILTYRKMTSKLLGHLKKIQKIRDGTHLEAISRNSKNSRWYPFGGGRNFDIQKNDLETARFGHLKKILKIRDGTPLEAEGILTYRKMTSKLLGHLKKIIKIRDVAGILVFKIRLSQEILKIRDGTPLEAEGILTYRKMTSKLLGLALFYEWHGFWFSKLGHLKKIIKIRDGTPLEAEGIMTYRKRAISRNSKNSRWYPFGGGRNFDIQKNDLETARFGHLKKILKIRDGTPLEAEGILTYRKMTSKLLGHLKKIQKIRDGTHLEAISRNSKNSRWYPFGGGRNFDIQKNDLETARFGHLKKILKIRDGTPLEAEGILTYRKMTSKLLGLALF
ncbi:hypothetical protein OROGR_013219 [Orobanche gracilis]